MAAFVGLEDARKQRELQEVNREREDQKPERKYPGMGAGIKVFASLQPALPYPHVQEWQWKACRPLLCLSRGSAAAGLCHPILHERFPL